MSPEQFDELTRRLANATSRRQMLKLLGGSALAVLGVLLGYRKAEAFQMHLCCVYFCDDGRDLHLCTKKSHCKPMPHCDLICAQVVTDDCSACKSVDCGASTI